MRRPLFVFVVAASAACAQPQERTIAYRSDTPIAERLEPGDRKVVVQMKMPDAPPAGAREESFEQEIQRLKKSEIIAIVRVSNAQGEIADLGTWVRTTIDAEIDRAVRVPAKRQPGSSVQFTFAGGTARIGDVEVSTGQFPQFVAGERYLVFLATRRGTADSLTWNGIGFRLDAQGRLQRVAISGGGEQSFRTNLIGRDATEVADALAR